MAPLMCAPGAADVACHVSPLRRPVAVRAGLAVRLDMLCIESAQPVAVRRGRRRGRRPAPAATPAVALEDSGSARNMRSPTRPRCLAGWRETGRLHARALDRRGGSREPAPARGTGSRRARRPTRCATGGAGGRPAAGGKQQSCRVVAAAARSACRNWPLQFCQGGVHRPCRTSPICLRRPAWPARVFIRADLNVPQDDAGNITEDTRIRASMPCIRMALDAGAAVMVTSHLGRPTEGAFKPEDSLAPVAQRLGELLGREVPLISDWVDGVAGATPGELVLLENCRVNKGEKKNDEALARKMAALCDIFVHDAFGTAHRAEASHLRHRAVCADRLRRPAAGGRDRRHHARRWPSPSARWWPSWPAPRSRPSSPSCKALADKVDQLIVGGGIANTFMLAAGLPIGKSLAEPRAAGRGAGGDRGDEGARRRGADPDRRGHGQDLRGRRAGHGQGRGRRGRRRPDPGHRPADRRRSWPRS